jgi:glutamyl-tRNA reductase
MPLVVVGLNHQTAPIVIRERLAIPSQRFRETLCGLKQKAALAEAVLLSTCNRFEAYFRAPDVSAIRSVILKLFSVIPESFLYQFTDSSCARHLFRVAAGLDSMVVGEQEILGQVKQAYGLAHAAGATGKMMNVLFQRALYIGKRIRTETGLSRGAISVGSIAVMLAERILGALGESRVIILGAGQMAELATRHLSARKVRSIIVSNRTYAHACELADQFGGAALRWEEGQREMVNADIVICSTGAPHPIIRSDMVREIMLQRRGRSLMFIDVAVPRGVHPEVHAIDNVYVYDIDDLQAIVDQHVAGRKKEIQAAEAIIEQQTQEFHWWLAALHAGLGHSLRHYHPILGTR